jgi:hypothetical protein
LICHRLRFYCGVLHVQKDVEISKNDVG